MAKILAIDDNRDNLTVLSALLAEAFPEIEFISALSGRKGIELCLSEKPDVILLDIVMPEMDGYEVCQILKADDRTKTIPVVMITAARTDKESRIKALEFGADAFLTKPLDESELTAQIRAMLRIKELEDLKLDEKERLKRLVEERTSQLEAELNERKRTEKALKQSEEAYRRVIDNVGEIIYSVSFNGNPIGGVVNFVSAQAEKILGYAPEEFLQNAELWFSIIHPDDAESVFRQTSSNFESRNFETRIYRMKHKHTGEYVWIEDHPQLLFDENGQIVGQYGTARDITRRKLAEEAIRERDEKIRSIFENVQDVYYESLLDGTILEISPSIKILSKGQACREDLIGKSLLDFYAYPEERTNVLSSMQKYGSVSDYELSIKNIDGSIIPCTISAKLVFDIQGHPEKTIGSLRDITQRKHDEEKIRESEAQFREFFEKAADAIFIAEIESGLIVDANEAALRLTHQSHDQLVGIHQSQLHPPVDENYAKDTFKKHKELVKQNVLSHIVENTVLRADGLEVPVEILASEVNYHGKLCLMGNFRDITERKKSEEALRESFEFNQSLLQTIPFGMDIVDEEGNILFLNENFENVFGKGVIGCKCWNLYCDDQKQCSQCPLHDGIKIGKTSTYESSGVMGGMMFEISHTGMMFKGKKAMLEIFQDITERKRSEQALQESQQLFQELFNASPDAIVLIDPSHPSISWPIVDCNEATCRMNGYTREELIGQSIDLLNIVPGLTEERNTYLEFLKVEGVFHSETLHRHKDGHIFPIEISTSVVTIGGKEMVLGIDRDISERKKADKELAIQKQRLTNILRGTNAGTWTWNVQTGEVILNDRWAEIIGYNLDELKPISINTWISNVYPDDLPAANERLNKHFNRELDYFDVEFRQPHKDGTLIWVNARGKVIEWTNDGKPLWISGTHLDITERKLAEAELQELNNRFGELVASTDGIVWEADAETFTFSFISENAERILGYKSEEWLQPAFWAKHIYLNDRDETVQFCVDQTNLCSDHDFEYRFVASDGRIVWLADFVKVILKNGKPYKLHGLMVDLTERKKSELALQESEDRYKSFISQVTEGVYRFECDEPMDVNLPLEEQVDFIYNHFFIAECNDAIVKMYKLSDQSEFIGKSHLDFHGGRDNEVNRELLREFIRKGYSIENGITEEFDRAGQLRYISNNSVGIIENGYLVRLWGTETDLTEKIRSEHVQQVLYAISNAALSSSDLSELIEVISDELGKLLDCTNFFIAFYDEETNMLSTIYEKDEKDVLDTWSAEKSITGYVVKNQKSLLLWETEMKELMESGEIDIYGTLSKVWLGVPLKLNKKVIGAIVVQSYDNPDAYTEKDKLMLEFISHQVSISIERKKTDQDLRLMGKAFDQSPVTIAITDKQGNIEYVNPKFTETSGYTLDEVKGKNPRVWQSGQQSKEYYKNLWETILAGNDWVGEFQNKRKNGELYWESAVISPIANENGDISFFLAIKEDITEKKKMIDDLIFAKNKAQESDRLKSAFLANMSHEIRTPLNSIVGFSDLLLDPDYDREQHAEFAKIISNSGNGLLSIISDIMDLSKIEAGQISLEKRKFSANQLVSEIQKEFSFNAIQKGLELKLDVSSLEDEFYLFSDQNRIRQVLINFIGNAIKFTENGVVEISLKKVGDYLLFSVSDTGIGISTEFHEQVFERFRQEESANTRKYGGNGLGLAISKSLIELLGGKIGMTSEKGKGSVFYFTIPL